MEVYCKQGRRYIPMGYEFTGFPSDGIWLVQNGTCNQMLLIGAKEDVPRHALPYRVLVDDLCKHLVKTFRDKPHSWTGIAFECADFFARKAEEGCERDGQTKVEQ